MTKIKTTLTHRANRMVTFGNLGKVKFDENCEAEVENELVEHIQMLDGSIELVDSKKQESKKDVKEIEVKAEEVKVEAAKEAVEETSNETDDKIIEDELDLSKMTLKQLQDAAKESKFPDSEWNKLNKAQMVKYMEGKLQEE